MKRIGIVGCGVSGLTCGIRLAEKGYAVEILTREETPRTTSDVAGAFWYPYRVQPQDLVLPWAERSYREFALLAEDPDSGVSVVPITHYYSEPPPEPWWTGCVGGLSRLDGESLPGNFSHGIRYQTFLIETPLYMPYLRGRFGDLGGEVRLQNVEGLTALGARYFAVVNCSGVWASQLAQDASVYPIRGQNIRAQRPIGLPPSILDADGVAVICRSTDCIIGGANEDGSWELAPRDADRALILQRVSKLYPPLSAPDIIEDRVGLRPGRPAVRVEAERQDGTLIVHNYGHGGAGFTLSWGCAEMVAELVETSY